MIGDLPALASSTIDCKHRKESQKTKNENARGDQQDFPRRHSSPPALRPVHVGHFITSAARAQAWLPSQMWAFLQISVPLDGLSILFHPNDVLFHANGVLLDAVWMLFHPFCVLFHPKRVQLDAFSSALHDRAGAVPSLWTPAGKELTSKMILTRDEHEWTRMRRKPGDAFL